MKRIAWIDCAKFVAIIAVLVNHLNGIVYLNYNICLSTYFSVSLFILLAGMTAYMGDQKHSGKWIPVFFRTVKSIGIAYLGATCIYQIAALKGFSFLKYVRYVVKFNVSGQMYFVCLYIQLMLVQWILFTLLEQKGRYIWLRELGLFLGIVILSYFTTNYTNILDIYGGGGKLFGGTYLILFYLGMVFAKHNTFHHVSQKRSVISAVIFGILLFLWVKFEWLNRFALDARLSFGEVNPPGITLIIMALLVCGFTFALVSVCEGIQIKCVEVLIHVIQHLGSSSLYIFLYHRLFLDYLLVPYVHISNPWLERIVYLGVMIAGSEILRQIFDWIKDSLKKMYRHQNA